MRHQPKHRILALCALFIIGCASADLPPIDKQSSFEPLPDEKLLWNRSLEEQSRLDNSGAIYDDPELHAYVSNVANKLVPEDVRSQGVVIKVRILKNPLLNAFAYPNGIMYLHTGILAKMENEAQLAALLGHEMSHTIHRHAAEGYRNLKNTTAVLATANIAMIPFGTYGSMASLLGSIGGMAAVTGYSRERESEADATGLRLMVDAGYDPREAPRLFEHIKKELEEQEIKEPFFFGTHPRLEERIESYNHLLATRYQNKTGYTGREDFEKYIAGLLLVNAEADYTMGRFLSARRCIDKYISLKPSCPEGHFYLGEFYRLRRDEKDTGQAAAAYREAIRCDPTHPGAHRGIGLIYYKQDRNEEARKAFETYLELAPDDEDSNYIRHYLRKLEAK